MGAVDRRGGGGSPLPVPSHASHSTPAVRVAALRVHLVPAATSAAGRATRRQLVAPRSIAVARKDDDGWRDLRWAVADDADVLVAETATLIAAYVSRLDVPSGLRVARPTRSCPRERSQDRSATDPRAVFHSSSASATVPAPRRTPAPKMRSLVATSFGPSSRGTRARGNVLDADTAAARRCSPSGRRCRPNAGPARVD